MSSPTVRTPPHRSEPALRSLEGQDVELFSRAVARGFHESFRLEDLDTERKLIEPDRMFGFQVEDRWVSTCGAFPRRMSVPGGAQLPVAAVTVVTVAPGYRRRGLLRAMMAHQLADVRARGSEPLALLWASESLIYGRFGYGSTTPHLSISGRTRSTAFLPDVELGDGSTDEVTREEFLAVVPGLRDRLAPERPGQLDRDGGWWDFYLYDAEHQRRGAGELRYVMHFAADGTPDGFATFRIKADSDITDEGGEVVISNLDAAEPGGHASLWRWLLDLDLVRAFRARHVPTDEPLRYLVSDQRAIKTEVGDATYARILDVEQALSARRYASEIDVVLEISDQFVPEVAGRYRLHGGPDGAQVTRTDSGADLTLSVRQLGSVYLGGTALTALHRAGLIAEHTPGAVLRTTAAFSGPRAPFCADFF